MNILHLIALLFAHIIGEGVLQSRALSVSKSKNLRALFFHTIVYSFTIAIVAYYSLGYIAAAHMFGITLVSHSIIDYITSRLIKHLSDRHKLWELFILIITDQVLHILQLIITFNFLYENFSDG